MVIVNSLNHVIQIVHRISLGADMRIPDQAPLEDFMELVMNAMYDYGFFKGVCLVACDVEKNEVTLKDKNGKEKSVYLSLFRKHGKLVSRSNGVANNGLNPTPPEGVAG